MSFNFLHKNQNYDQFNEFNREERLLEERKIPAENFFNDSGNPFIGFLKLLRRKPVKSKPISLEGLQNDVGGMSREKSFLIKLVLGVFVFFMVVIMILGFIMCVDSDFGHAIEGPLIGIFVPMPFIIAIIVAVRNKHRSEFGKNGYSENDYKAYVVNRALYKTVDELIYEPYFGIPYNVLASTELLPDAFGETTDYITGKYNGTYFVCANLCITGNSDFEGSIFCGEWLIFKYPKPFKGLVKITDNMYMFETASLRSVASIKKTKPIKMENKSFNDIFHVESSDQELAYYLLTPQILEKIMHIKNMTSGHLLIGFCDGYIHIGLNRRLLVNMDYKEANIENDVENLSNGFKFIAKLIETFESDAGIYKF